MAPWNQLMWCHRAMVQEARSLYLGQGSLIISNEHQHISSEIAKFIIIGASCFSMLRSIQHSLVACSKRLGMSWCCVSGCRVRISENIPLSQVVQDECQPHSFRTDHHCRHHRLRLLLLLETLLVLLSSSLWRILINKKSSSSDSPIPAWSIHKQQPANASCIYHQACATRLNETREWTTTRTISASEGSGRQLQPKFCFCYGLSSKRCWCNCLPPAMLKWAGLGIFTT